MNSPQKVYEYEGKHYIRGEEILEGTPGGEQRLYIDGPMGLLVNYDPRPFGKGKHWAIEVPGPAPDGFEYLPEEPRLPKTGDWYYPRGVGPMLAYHDHSDEVKPILRKLHAPQAYSYPYIPTTSAAVAREADTPPAIDLSKAKPGDRFKTRCGWVAEFVGKNGKGTISDAPWAIRILVGAVVRAQLGVDNAGVFHGTYEPGHGIDLVAPWTEPQEDPSPKPGHTQGKKGGLETFDPPAAKSEGDRLLEFFFPKQEPVAPPVKRSVSPVAVDPCPSCRSTGFVIMRTKEFEELCKEISATLKPRGVILHEVFMKKLCPECSREPKP